MSDLTESILLLALAVSGSIVIVAGAILFLVSSLSATLTDRARLRIAGMGNLLSLVGAASWLIGVALAIHALFW